MKTKLLKFACYTTNISQALVANFSPLLFITFHNSYNISYSLLGLLVLVNFVTQLSVDVIFSLFSHKFNMSKTVKITPFLTVVGFLVYALSPFFLPKEYIYFGLLAGTVIFSASGGLAEVLISPVIAAIPAKDPDKEMSKLHSIYAWGVVGVIIFSTLFIFAFGADKWQYLALILTVLPLTSFILFLNSKVPKLETPKKASGALQYFKNKKLWVCVFAIFLGGASEIAMAQWCSGYLEQALGIEKVWGDIFGVAVFGLTLGLGRTLYAKVGKNITKVVFLGAVGASACYLTAALSNIPLLGLAACALTGFFVSMMWPGCLIIASEYFPNAGVFIFAIMAAGGDLGASVGPQLIGIITDTAQTLPWLNNIAVNPSLTPEDFGMKLGILIASLFPLIAISLYWYIHADLKRKK